MPRKEKKKTFSLFTIFIYNNSGDSFVSVFTLQAMPKNFVSADKLCRKTVNAHKLSRRTLSMQISYAEELGLSMQICHCQCKIYETAMHLSTVVNFSSQLVYCRSKKGLTPNIGTFCVVILT